MPAELLLLDIYETLLTKNTSAVSGMSVEVQTIHSQNTILIIGNGPFPPAYY